MQIMSVTYNPYNKNVGKKTPQFTGMTKYFKNQIYLDGQKDIEGIIDKHQDVRPVVGQLPRFITEKLPVENRREAVNEILDVFDEVALSIRNFDADENSTIDEINNRRPKKVNDILSDVLRKYRVISKWDDDVNIKYLDAGGKGKVYKLEGLMDNKNEDEFVIKIFHQIKGKNWQPYKSHGCYAEINSGIYWRNQEGFDTHRGKFFFASLGSGYIFSKFLDEDVRLPQRTVKEYHYGIKCTDEEKSGALNGYNRLKGYNYDYGGMRVVNRVKNNNKVARHYLKEIRELPPQERASCWISKFKEKKYSENVVAGLALAIKYMENKSFYIDRCLELEKPLINQSVAYVLKYLPHKDAVKYFEKLVQTDDAVTQVILFNEIPLLSKRKNENTEVKDDIAANSAEIASERINTYYMIAEKYALPETIEHLASFVHLLPDNKVKQMYEKLANIDNCALQDRLLWKLSMSSKDFIPFALEKLAARVNSPILKERLVDYIDALPSDDRQRITEILENR